MDSLKTVPNLQTNNLILKHLDEKDVFDIFNMRKNPIMIQYTDGKVDESIEETIQYIRKMNKGVEEGKWIIWAIELKSTKQVIGSISIWNIDFEKEVGELGFGLNPKYHSKGIMKEALVKVIDFAFSDFGLKEVQAYTQENNTNSVKLLERLNFKEINRIQEKGYYKKQLFNMIVYSLNKENQI